MQHSCFIAVFRRLYQSGPGEPQDKPFAALCIELCAILRLFAKCSHDEVNLLCFLALTAGPSYTVVAWRQKLCVPDIPVAWRLQHWLSALMARLMLADRDPAICSSRALSTAYACLSACGARGCGCAPSRAGCPGFIDLQISTPSLMAIHTSNKLASFCPDTVMQLH